MAILLCARINENQWNKIEKFIINSTTFQSFRLEGYAGEYLFYYSKNTYAVATYYKQPCNIF